MNVEQIISRCIEASVSLTLKGDNISVNGDLALLDKAVITEIKNNKQEIISWLKAQQKTISKSTAIRPHEHTGLTHPVTPGQKLIWLLDNVEGHSAQYNKSSAIKVDRLLSHDHVQRAVTSLVQRHESLRTRFVLDEDMLRQVIDSEPKVCVSQYHLNSEEDEPLICLADELAKKPFDLANDALLRVDLIHITDSWSVVLFTVHHIVADGWSEGILFNEFCTFFGAAESGTASPQLPELPIQFSDYVYWLEENLRSGAWKASLDYWSEQLGGVPATHNLPMDNPRPVHQTYNGGGIQIALDRAQISKLEALASAHNTTLYTVLETAYALLLCRWSNESEIVVGTAVSGREVDPQLSGQIGYYSNVVALRTQLEEQQTFAGLLKHNKQIIADAFSNQTVPFAEVIEHLKVPVDPSHAPIYQVSFTLEHQHKVDAATVASGISPLPLSVSDSLFDLSLFVMPHDEVWQLLWQYNSDLFSEHTMSNIAHSYVALLSAICNNPQADILELNMTSEAQLEQLKVWNHGQQVALEFGCVLEAICSHAGDITAVIDANGQHTYADIERESNRLAKLLLARGVNAGDSVLSCCERSAELVISALGTMKAGAVYLPVDSNLPKERIAQIARASGVKIALSQKSQISKLPLDVVSVLPLDAEFRDKLFATYSNDAPDNEVNATQEAYMIFTSGTTGIPKGVKISHQALSNLCQWHSRTYKLEQGIRTSLLAGNGFDASIWEMFPSLYSGATLVCVDDATRNDPELLISHLTTHQVTQAFIPTSLLHILDELNIIQSTGLEVILTGGDKLNRIKNLPKSECHIFNHYGPTEATVLVCSSEVKAGQRSQPPIGAVIDNTQLYVMNTKGILQPPGAFGELYVSGTSVMNGYHDMDESILVSLNAFEATHLAYRTGDFVRYLSNGELAYGYRKDSQVKLSGFRIEIAEVISQLLAQPTINNAWVTMQQEGEEEHLVAYVVSQNELDANLIKAKLRAKLPSYMVPSGYMQLPTLPVNVNGKIDQHALPRVALVATDAYVAPSDEVERKIQEIWQAQLNISPIGVTSNFFDVGGNSLAAIAVVNRVNNEFDIVLSVAEAIKRNSIHSQAEFVRQVLKIHTQNQLLDKDSDVEVMEW